MTIITSEIEQISDFLEKIDLWKKKVHEVQGQRVHIKKLQSLVSEARALPVTLPHLRELKQRHQRSTALIEKIHATVIKTSRTRTGTQAGSDKRSKEKEVRGIVNELQELLVTNGDIQQLEEHLEQIE